MCGATVENLHSPSKSTKGGRIAWPLWFRGITWLRGSDLNRRPLGYEGKSSHHRNQDEPTQANQNDALSNGAVGVFGLVAVGVLHSWLIGGGGGWLRGGGGWGGGALR